MGEGKNTLYGFPQKGFARGKPGRSRPRLDHKYNGMEKKKILTL
jgi:hypothetical protein